MENLKEAHNFTTPGKAQTKIEKLLETSEKDDNGKYIIKDKNWNIAELKEYFTPPGRDTQPRSVKEVHIKPHEDDFPSPIIEESQDIPKDTIGILAVVPVRLKLSIDKTRLVWPMEEKKSGRFPEGLRGYDPKITLEHQVGECHPEELIKRYKDAFGGNTDKIRIVIAANVYDDPLNTKLSTEWHKNELKKAIDEFYASLTAEEKKYVAIAGYVTEPTLYDAYRKTYTKDSADNIRTLFERTQGWNGKALDRLPGNFPFADVRLKGATNAAAKHFLTQLERESEHVFVHTGDGDVISLKDMFQNLSEEIKRHSTPHELALVAGARTFDESDVRRHVMLKVWEEIAKKKYPADQSQDIRLQMDKPEVKEHIEKMVQLTMLYSSYDEQFRRIMCSGEISAGWFSESNTLINAKIIKNQDTSNVLSQDSAKRNGKPDYCIPLLKAVTKNKKDKYSELQKKAWETLTDNDKEILSKKQKELHNILWSKLSIEEKSRLIKVYSSSDEYDPNQRVTRKASKEEISDAKRLEKYESTYKEKAQFVCSPTEAWQLLSPEIASCILANQDKQNIDKIKLQNEIPTKSLFLQGSEYTLKTSAGHEVDKLYMKLHQLVDAETFYNQASDTHNFQFRGSQVEATAEACCPAIKAEILNMFTKKDYTRFNLSETKYGDDDILRSFDEFKRKMLVNDYAKKEVLEITEMILKGKEDMQENIQKRMSELPNKIEQKLKERGLILPFDLGEEQKKIMDDIKNNKFSESTGKALKKFIHHFTDDITPITEEFENMSISSNDNDNDNKNTEKNPLKREKELDTDSDGMNRKDHKDKGAKEDSSGDESFNESNNENMKIDNK